MAKITIFGLAGTGTSTLGRALAAKIGYEFLSPGMLFRQKAAERGMTLEALDALAETDRQIDMELDQEIKVYGETHDNFVVEGRLGWFFIPDSIKIKLICDYDERVRRVAQREGISFAEAKEQTVFREEIHERRYEEAYGVTPEQYGADHIFDLIIDTTHNNAEMTLEETYQCLKQRDPSVK